MDPGFLLVENFARFAAAVGLAVAAPLFAWGGYLWMTSMGDPNRSAAARNAVISVVIGIIIIGSSFFLPRVVGEFVVAPAGGVVFEREPGINCDGMLRQQLVINRSASTPTRMNFLVERIQGRYEDCNPAFWAPKVRDRGHSHVGGCYDTGDKSIAGVEIPEGLERGTSRPSRRDARNNIMVHFLYPEHPADGSICWMYVSSLESWVEEYVNWPFPFPETQKQELTILF